jgi:hypothetical protein
MEPGVKINCVCLSKVSVSGTVFRKVCPCCTVVLFIIVGFL